MVTGADDPVGLVDEDNGGLDLAHEGLGYLGVGHDDDEVADVYLVGGRTVELDGARATPSGNRVGGQAFAVVDVDDVNLLAGHNVRGVQQILVHGD